MAGDWIKMRVDLAADPNVIGISIAVGLDEDYVVGKLHKLWSWADQHTTDGNAKSVTQTWLDRYVGVDGFADALAAVGWLVVSDDGISIPDFERHNGESGKRRALTANRAAKRRSKSNAPTVTKSAPTQSKSNATTVTKSAPREEKRREEKKDDHVCSWNKKLVPVSQLKDWCLETFLKSPDGRAALFTREHLDRHPDTRDMLLRVGVLRLSEAISEAFVQDGCEALRRAERWPGNPGGYLRTVWQASKYIPDGADETWFADLLDAVQLPAEI